MILLLPIAALGAWAFSDWRRGEVMWALLLIPCIALPFYDFLWFLAFFLQPLLLLAWLKIRLFHDSLGGADIIAVPFTIFFMTLLRPLALAAFPVAVLAIVGLRAGRIALSKTPRDTTRIRLIPYLFAGFLASLSLHLILPLLVPGFFL